MFSNLRILILILLIRELIDLNMIIKENYLSSSSYSESIDNSIDSVSLILLIRL